MKQIARKIVGLALLLATLSIGTSTFANPKTSNFLNAEGNSELSQQDDFGKALQQIFDDAKRTAVRDSQGKVSQIEIQPFTEKRQVFKFNYQENQISSFKNAIGAETKILRDQSGKITGFEYADGTKIVYKWKSSQSNPHLLDGIEMTPSNGEPKLYNMLGGKLNISSSKTNMLQKDALFILVSGKNRLDACSRAINTAGAAALVASVACASGSETCPAALVAAAVAAYNAYETCNEPQNQ